MLDQGFVESLSAGWIVTLDVLKCAGGAVPADGGECWIVTLDVLK